MWDPCHGFPAGRRRHAIVRNRMGFSAGDNRKPVHQAGLVDYLYLLPASGVETVPCVHTSGVRARLVRVNCAPYEHALTEEGRHHHDGTRDAGPRWRNDGAPAHSRLGAAGGSDPRALHSGACPTWLVSFVSGPPGSTTATARRPRGSARGFTSARTKALTGNLPTPGITALFAAPVNGR